MSPRMMMNPTKMRVSMMSILKEAKGSSKKNSKTEELVKVVDSCCRHSRKMGEDTKEAGLTRSGMDYYFRTSLTSLYWCLWVLIQFMF